MAFPVVESTATTGRTAAETTSPVTFPATVSANALIVCIARAAVAGVIGWPANWVELVENDADASDDVTAIAYFTAVGNEDGTTFNVTHGNGKSAYIVYSITGAEAPATAPPQISATVVGTTTTPDPASLTPDGGAKDFLWLWLGGWEGEQTSPPASSPTNYATPLGASTGAGGAVATNCRVGSAQRNLNASVENPGSWTISASDDWSAWTMAVPPIGPVVVTVPVATTITTRFVPVLKHAVIPPVVALASTRFAPILKLAVIPPATTLATATFVPVLKLAVTPPVAVLTTTRFAPTVTIVAGGTVVTPPVATLTSTRFAPVLKLSVIPPVASLISARFAPTLKLVVTPPTATLTTTRFAPVLRLAVIPPTAALATVRFAPTLALSVIPGVRALSTTAFTPTVLRGQVFTPPTLALLLAAFAPSATAFGRGAATVLDASPYTAALSDAFAASATIGDAAPASATVSDGS